MKINIKNKISGFTLIETIIYVLIFSVFVGSLVSFMNIMISSRLNNQITLEINNQGNQVIRIITQSIRNATAINSPIISTTSDNLNITTPDSLKNPTMFYLNNGVLYIKEGTSPDIALINGKVIVSNLVFSNLSNPSTSGSIEVRFTLTSVDHIAGQVAKTVDFYGSGTIKK